MARTTASVCIPRWYVLLVRAIGWLMLGAVHCRVLPAAAALPLFQRVVAATLPRLMRVR